MLNILIGQSGGPTAVINASLYGAIQEAEKRGITIYGMLHGIEGFLKGEVVNLSEYSKKVDLSLLKSTPASFLGSCRYRLPNNLDDSIYAKIFDRFREYQ
ncbi:MAG: 6-phosphofructokinase, partial [Lachnospiraceae bacterium]